MRISIKVSFIFVAIWFVGKMAFFYFQVFQDPQGVKFLVMWNMLCLLLGMTIGTMLERRKQKQEEGTALQDIKQTIASGMVYAVAVAILLYFYYGKIDPGYNARQQAVAIERVEKMLDTEKEMTKIRKDNPELSTMSDDEIRTKTVENQKVWYGPGMVSTIGLLGMMMLSTLNAIVLAVVFRRVFSKI